MNQADMIFDLSAVWAAVKEVFPYFGRLAFDWDELYREYLEKLLLGCDEATFHRLLSQFLDSLEDGHTKYIPPAPFRDKPPFVPPEPPSSTLADGVLTVRLNEFLHDHAPYVRSLLEASPALSLVRLDIRDNIGGNTFYAASVAQLFISGVFHGCQKWTQAHNAVDVASASLLAGYSDERARQYIRDGLLKEEDFEEARTLARHMAYETYTDTWGSEDGTALWQGPLHILISRRTMSAAEDFAAMFRSSGRGTLIGEPTFGSTGTPYHVRLRCGGRAQVVSVGYRLLDGTEFIGKGIAPDIAAADE